MITEPFSAYAARPDWNWSVIKEAARSPLHAKWKRDNDSPDTRARELGRATHCAIFEPDRLPLDYVVWPDEAGQRRGKKWDEFCAANAGKSILREVDYLVCLGMRDAVHRHKVARDLLVGCLAEQVITWLDPLTGLPLKGRLDGVQPSRALLDLKTTASLDPPWFASRVARLMYHGQLAHYLGGLREAEGLELPAKIIAVESAPPYDVAVLALDDDAVWAGENLARDLVHKVAGCVASGVWPGRLEEETVLSLPAWCFPAADDSDPFAEAANA